MPTMPRLMLQACTALACAGLLFASAMASSGAADACSESYKVCNGGCDRVAERVLACKSGCDVRLIACDREPVNAAVQGGSTASPPSRQLRGVENPIVTGRDGQ